MRDLLLERDSVVKAAAGKVIAHLTADEGWLVMKQRGEPAHQSQRAPTCRADHLRPICARRLPSIRASA